MTILSGAGGELGTVGHDDLDGVIVGMDVGFHGSLVGRQNWGAEICAVYIVAGALRQAEAA
jgi:hypothetical protein